MVAQTAGARPNAPLDDLYRITDALADAGPAVVIAVFMISLVECLIILPAHLAWGPTEPGGGLLGQFERRGRRRRRR